MENLQLDDRVCFFKMQGCGNDFILIDNRCLGLGTDAMPEWARVLCRRAFGIGADGLIFLDRPRGRDDVAYMWHFYNADGSRAEMCGNGARCAAKLAVALDMAKPHHVFGTDAGSIEAEVLGNGQVKVALTKAGRVERGVLLDTPAGELIVHFVNTGVPHAVMFTDDVDAVDVKRLGALIRYHGRFAPAGTNANFVQVLAPGRLKLRTYERGVEDETYACGTGACASALAARELGLGGEEYEITTTGGEILHVDLSGGGIYLTGAAQDVFNGALSPAGLGLPCQAGQAARGAGDFSVRT